MNRLIVAVDRKLGLAKNGGMPWFIPQDEAFFTSQTKTYGGHVLTGGVTFREAYKGRPLKDRQNYILTRDNTPIEGVTLVHDLANFLADLGRKDLWVSGGSTVFKQIMMAGKADELYITHIDADFGCDQFFPAYEENFQMIEQSPSQEQNGFIFTFAKYIKK